MPQHVKIVDYNPCWPQKYDEEKEKVREILKDNCLAVYHIGSTSVPGLSAKPVIDIMAAVRNLEQVDRVSEDFIRLGYEYLGEFGIAGRRYLRKGEIERTHQIHIFCGSDTENILRHLAFADYLRSNERDCREYAALKKELAQRFPWDIDSYCNGKDSFVKSLEKKALSQYDDIWDRLFLAAGMVKYERNISPMVEAGGVSSALLSKSGKIYTGVCIDTASSLGMCAERNAIANMITCGEHEIIKIVAVMRDGKAGMPCGACREFMMQLGGNAENIEFLVDYETKETVRLKDLVPRWWHEKI